MSQRAQREPCPLCSHANVNKNANAAWIGVSQQSNLSADMMISPSSCSGSQLLWINCSSKLFQFLCWTHGEKATSALQSELALVLKGPIWRWWTLFLSHFHLKLEVHCSSPHWSNIFIFKMLLLKKQSLSKLCSSLSSCFSWFWLKASFPHHCLMKMHRVYLHESSLILFSSWAQVDKFWPISPFLL